MLQHLNERGTEAMLESILIVDDIPENLSLLHESLDQAGYQVLVATSGLTALEIAHRSQPDMILLDGSMPEMDGFETCFQLKSSPVTQHIPVIFMTGLTETEHIVRGFQVGGVDYVTKPLNIDEVQARVKTHLLHARLMHQQKQMLDATGSAIMSLNLQGEMIWQTPVVEFLLQNHQVERNHFQSILKAWLQDLLQQPDQAHLIHGQYGQGQQQLQLNLLTKLDRNTVHKHILVQLKEQTQMPSVEEIIQACSNLTPREAEVMHWVTMGKTNRDIAEILELSPRTVNKHLEHVFEKLYVETRTAAVLHIVSACKNLTGA
jgi:DNA-binding response OmpR family regulator